MVELFILFFIFLVITVLFFTKALLINNIYHVFLVFTIVVALIGGFFAVNKYKMLQQIEYDAQVIVNNNITEEAKIENNNNVIAKEQVKPAITPQLTVNIIKVGVNADTSPYFYTKNNIEQGVEFSLINKIAKDLNFSIVYIPINFKNADKMLKDKLIDIAIGAFNKSNFSKASNTNTIPYAETKAVFVSLKNNLAQINKKDKKSFLKSFNNKTIGVLYSQQEANYLANQLKGYNVIIKSYASVSELYQDLQDKKINLAFLDKRLANLFLNDSVIISNKYLLNNKIELVLKVEDNDLKLKINNILLNSKEYTKQLLNEIDNLNAK